MRETEGLLGPEVFSKMILLEDKSKFLGGPKISLLREDDVGLSLGWGG